MRSYNIVDPDFGTIQLTVNQRARRIIMRPVVDGLRVTVPWAATQNDIVRAIDKYRKPLLEKWKIVKQRPVTTDDEIERLRRMAKLDLPRRVAELAYLHGFHYEDLKIQSSRTRWGSCSGRNNINLSLFLMRLPDYLIDYVILHELCHTVHHNHSAAFWNLLNKVSGGKSDEYKAELKKFNTN